MRAASNWYKSACRLLGAVVLAALLSGCDKCGDWLWGSQGDTQVCRQQAPKPQ